MILKSMVLSQAPRQASLVRGRNWGVEKRGEWKTSRMTPLPKGGFGPLLVRYVFHPPQVSVLCFFLYKNPRQSRPEALLEGSKIFRESAFSGTFSSPHTFCTPPISRPKLDVVLSWWTSSASCFLLWAIHLEVASSMGVHVLLVVEIEVPVAHSYLFVGSEFVISRCGHHEWRHKAEEESTGE